MTEPPTGLPAIEAEDLVKRYGETTALAGLNLTIPQGTIYGLLGPNGAGKTTAVRVFATLLRPDGGQARVLGHDVTSQAGQVRELIGLTGQYAALDEYLTGRSNLVMIGRLSRLPAREARRRADELLERFELVKAADLAASLIARPRVLFLDEPTTGLDPNARSLVWEMVRDLAADGTTLLLTTQYLEEADQLCSHIAVIDTGKVIAEGTPDKLKAAIGDEHLEITLAPGADLQAAAIVLKPLSSSIHNDGERRLSVAVSSADGLTTSVVRALDEAGIAVNDVTIRRASLDDVFRTLTGRAA
jgi:ABC-2 type transport system ATP-binding protein